jgi:RNA methyltransferase, TrmH family
MEHRIIQSKDHPLVKQLVKLRRDRGYRNQEKKIVIEGIKPILDLANHICFSLLVLEEGKPIPLKIKAKEIIFVSTNVMKKISCMETPQGVLVVAQMPEKPDLSDSKKLVVINGIQDPGNVGTLLRTSWAFGWCGAIITEGSADPFNDKAISASRGASVLFPFINLSTSQTVSFLNEIKACCLVADTKGNSVESVRLTTPLALVLGSEAMGPSLEFKKMGKIVTLEMESVVDSLNVAVAGGILLYNIKIMTSDQVLLDG